VYFDPEEKRGILFAFRQEECEEKSLELNLPDIGNCTVTDKDSGEKIPVNNKMINIEFERPRCAKAFWIEGE
jgi:hypothetical protein